MASSDPWDPDTMFGILADPYRRHLVSVLREDDRTDRIFLDSLSARLAERDPVADDPERIACKLHHCHLPKLDEAGLIRYEPTSTMVEFTGLSEDRLATSFEDALGN